MTRQHQRHILKIGVVLCLISVFVQSGARATEKPIPQSPTLVVPAPLTVGIDDSGREYHQEEWPRPAAPRARKPLSQTSA